MAKVIGYVTRFVGEIIFATIIAWLILITTDVIIDRYETIPAARQKNREIRKSISGAKEKEKAVKERSR